MAGQRIRIVLACSDCGARNYQTTRARKSGEGARIELKKYCRFCKSHTVHKEAK